MPQFELTTIDLVMVAGYAALILFIGFWVSRSTDTTEDYFLAGRNLTWPLIGLSLFASNISSSTLIGLAGEAYSNGIAVYNYEWFAAVVLVFFLIFFLPFYLKHRIYTMPEFLERRFDGRSRIYVSSSHGPWQRLDRDGRGTLCGRTRHPARLSPDPDVADHCRARAAYRDCTRRRAACKAVVYTDAIQAVLLILGSIAISVARLCRSRLVVGCRHGLADDGQGD